MKLKYTLEFVEMGNEIVAVPLGKNSEEVKGILKLNKEGLEILKMMTAHFESEDIIDALSLKYDNDRNELKRYVDEIVETLQNAGIVEE